MQRAAHKERSDPLRVMHLWWPRQCAQHARQLAVAAEGQHMDRPGTDLRALEGLRGEAAARVRQSLHHHDALAAPQELRGGEEPAESRADYHHIVLVLQRPPSIPPPPAFVAHL